MRCDDSKRCPSCGNFLTGSEKIQYGGKNDCQSKPFVFCPACGWKQRCSERDEDLFPYR